MLYWILLKEARDGQRGGFSAWRQRPWQGLLQMAKTRRGGEAVDSGLQMLFVITQYAGYNDFLGVREEEETITVAAKFQT